MSSKRRNKETLLDAIAHDMSSPGIPFYPARYNRMRGLAFRPTQQGDMALYVAWSFIEWPSVDSTSHTYRGIGPHEITFIGARQPKEDDMNFMKAVWDRYFRSPDASPPRPVVSLDLYRESTSSNIRRREAAYNSQRTPSCALISRGSDSVCDSTQESVPTAAESSDPETGATPTPSSSSSVPASTKPLRVPTQPVVKRKSETQTYHKKTVVNDLALAAGSTVEQRPRLKAKVIKDQYGTRVVYS